MEVIQPIEVHSIDYEVLKKMEDEHLRLQRQVRLIQVDRQHRNMGVHPQFRRQDMLMQALKKEYRNLSKDLKIARSGAHKKKDKKMKIELRKSLLLRVAAQQECDANVSMMQQYNGLIQKNYKETMNLRKLASTTQGKIEERRWQSEYRLISAENKLEAAKLRFNAVQSENKKIREEIEHMLRDRALFNQSWDKMMAVLGKGKKFLYDLFESSTLAYDQRDEWCTKLKTMQEKGKIDQMLQVQEMRDLIKAYDHEMKVYQFLATKGMTRINRKQEFREEELRRIADEKLKKRYQYHVQLLDDISDYTGENSTRKILDVFRKKEQENFSIYLMLTMYCSENQVLRRDVQDIRQKIYDRRECIEQTENKQKNKMDKLLSLLEEQKARTEAIRKKNEEKKQLIHDVMIKINDMFTMLDCSLEPFHNLLGDKHPSVHQLQLSLQLITEKIKTYKEYIYYYEHCLKKSEKTGTSRLRKYTLREEPPVTFKPVPISTLVPADPCPSCVEARWLSRIFDGTELPFDTSMAIQALRELSSDPAYVRSDRVHTITECIVPRSRALLARRYVNH
ncbi:outer dynein arm protein 1-like isoform X1 [Spodoptera litura]|uniref:Outer dynein arm protein 1-like isoform X1 n=1 Tax=Spodoptera litura TaxID=69820 RepID=A0A9J7EB31_SPOLT|nr:outer dynein arm protein 1-like isoform X1 [Spodoptera litura]